MLFCDPTVAFTFTRVRYVSVRIYTTTLPTPHRIRTLMHDPQYRLAIAWQNVVYNKPPQPGFFLGHGMKPPPLPRILLVKALD